MVQRIASVTGSLILVFAAMTAIRLAVAEARFRQDTPGSVRAAIALQRSTPSAEYFERLAELDADHAQEQFEHVVRDINPRASAAWMELGQLGGGESALLTAAEVDHQYLPAWTLANFYFRQGNRDAFWRWIDRSASLMYDEYPPLFQLCEQFEQDPARTLAHFRDARRMRPPYLKYLIAQNRLDAAQTVAREMAADRANDPHLIDLADRQIRAGHPLEALELWNLASGFSAINPATGKILTNGDLAKAPLNLGFDWRLSQVEGVATNWRPSELIFRLSGSEPERCVLLEQTILLPPRNLRLRFDYLMGSPSPSGLRWSLDEKAGPQIEPSETWKESVFDLPRGRGLAQLQLRYRREPGTIRTEGRMEIRNLRMEQGQ
jgi:hypothetical protein